MVNTFSVYIPAFKEERLIRVYVPTSYETSEKHYPVLYMHDGQNVFHDKDAIGGVSLNLEKYLDKQQLDVIVVAIDQNSEERKNEYCPWLNGEYSKQFLPEGVVFGGKGAEYVDFIVHDLKPLIDKRFRTLKNETAMVGISLGGLITTYAACRYPRIFKNIAVLSSGFYANQEELEKLIKESDLSEINSFYLDCGTKESNDDYIAEQCVSWNRAIYTLLKEKINNVTFEVVSDGEHNYLSFQKRVEKLFSFINEK
mgnify:CR=1 FL=1